MSIRKNIISFNILLSILIYLSIFRWNVGIDWETYVDIFSGDFSLQRIEPANLLIKKVLTLLDLNDARYWIGFMAAFSFILISKTILKLSNTPFYSLLLFVCFGFFFDSLNMIRQFAAIALFVYSWNFIFLSRKKEYFVLILVAFLFHSTAIILIPFYFLYKIKIKRKTLIVSFFTSIVMSFYLESILADIVNLFSLYADYSDTRFIQSNLNSLSYLRMVFPIILFIFIIYKYDEIVKNRKHLLLLNISLLSIFITLLMPTVMLAIRIGLYFQISFIFFIPILASYYSKRLGFQIKLFALIYGCFFIYFTLLSKPIAQIIPFTLKFDLFPIIFSFPFVIGFLLFLINRYLFRL